MKKELALTALAAMIAVSTQTQAEKQEIAIENEVNMDMYVTGCQCRSPRPHWVQSSSEDIV